MKKLKLKALELGASELLTREQLKSVLGGDGSGGGSGGGGFGCSDNGCLLYVAQDNINQWLSGTCGVSYSGGIICVCTVRNGSKTYQTNNGGTTCYN